MYTQLVTKNQAFNLCLSRTLVRLGIGPGYAMGCLLHCLKFVYLVSDGCMDNNANCDYYPDSACQVPYVPWAKANCALRCDFCPGKNLMN